MDILFVCKCTLYNQEAVIPIIPPIHREMLFELHS